MHKLSTKQGLLCYSVAQFYISMSLLSMHATIILSIYVHHSSSPQPERVGSGDETVVGCDV